MPRTSVHSASLTAEQFEELVAAHPLMQESSRQAAYAVLVDGLSLQASAERHDLTRQRVSELVGIVAPPGLRRGWVRRLVTLPPELMERVREMERDALRDAAR